MLCKSIILSIRKTKAKSLIEKENKMSYNDNELVEITENFLCKVLPDTVERNVSLVDLQEGQEVYCLFSYEGYVMLCFNVAVKSLVRADTVEEVEAMLAGAFVQEFTRKSPENFFEDVFKEIQEDSMLERANLALYVINSLVESVNHLCKTYCESQDSKVRGFFREWGTCFGIPPLEITGRH